MRITFSALALLPLLPLLALAASCSDSTSPPGPPSNITVLTGANLRVAAGDTFQISLKVVDSSGRGMPGVPLTASAAIGVVLDSATRTDGHGKATLRVVASTRAFGDIVYVSFDPSTYPGGGPQSIVEVDVPFESIAGPFTQFAPHASTRLAGATFAVDSLFTPTDRYGNATSWPTVQVAASNGWTVTATTLTPPTATYTGTTSVSVTSGMVSAIDTVSVVEDLRKYHWSVQWKCDFTHSNTPGLPDSTSASGTNGFVTYPTDSGYAPIFAKSPTPSPVVEFWFSGTETLYRHDAGLPQGIMTGEPYGLDVFSQRPDTLIFGLPPSQVIAVRAPGAVPRYATNGWCGNGPLVLQAY